MVIWKHLTSRPARQVGATQLVAPCPRRVPTDHDAATRNHRQPRSHPALPTAAVLYRHPLDSLVMRSCNSNVSPPTTGSADRATDAAGLSRTVARTGGRLRDPTDMKVSTAAKYSNDRIVQHVRLHPDASGRA
jgi:hypothetical protein